MELNVKNCELSCPATGKTMKLAAKEFQLTEYFMRNPGRVLTREQIAEKIWGFDSEAEYNNVEVYISFIRKKMNFIGVAGCSVKAIRGVGYIMESASK